MLISTRETTGKFIDLRNATVDGGGRTKMVIGERIRELRERAGFSQSELARRLGISRTSVNAWESGLSAPTAQFIIELSKLFHVSSDYILGLYDGKGISLATYTEQEIKLLYELMDYFDRPQKR